MAKGTLIRLGTRFVTIRAAVIDLDGTMVDTLGDFVHALERAFQTLNLPLADRSVVARLIGKGPEHLVRSVLAHAQASPTLYGPAAELYALAYREINGRHSTVFPGVMPGITALQNAGLRLTCLTNKPTALARDLLAMKGLLPAFPLLFGGDSFERKKPDPLPVLKTCEAMGIAPNATLVIGDSVNDAEAARAAGCPVVLVSYGYNHGCSVHNVDADRVVDSLTELI